MTTFERALKEYSEKHPDATTEEAVEHASRTAEFERVLYQLDRKTVQFIHDMLQTIVEGREQNNGASTVRA